MKALLSILFGLLLIGGAFFMLNSVGVGPENDTPVDVESASSTASVFGASETWATVTERRLTEDWVFAVRVPLQVQTNSPQAGVHTFKYIGPQSQTASEITDGFFFSLSAQPNTTVAEYLATNNPSGKTVPVSFNGFDAQSYITKNAVGNQDIPHVVFVLADGSTVVDVTQSYYGERSSEYQMVGQKMLNTLSFSQSEAEMPQSAPVIEIQSPQAGDSVTSPISVSGQARGYWFFEATAPVTVTNWDGLVIGEGYIEADEDWMTEDFVPFSGSIMYTQQPSPYSATGTIIFHKANASGLPENDAAVEITVQLEDNSN
jgi:hypothetical protein